jgi:large subunit ribosomal protein L40e
MQIFVIEKDRTLTLEVSPNDTIDEVKRKLSVKVKEKPAAMSLIFAAKTLEHGILLDYSVYNDCTMRLCIKVIGG